jgi:hypothetical protein
MMKRKAIDGDEQDVTTGWRRHLTRYQRAGKAAAVKRRIRRRERREGRREAQRQE